MAISGVSAVNKVSEVTAVEATDFITCKVTKLQSFSDVTIKIYPR